MTSDRGPTDDDLRARFEAAMKRHGPRPRRPPEQPSSGLGPRLIRGTIDGIAGDDVFVDLGARLQGVLPLSDFGEPPRVGQDFEFTVVGDEGELWELSRKEARRLASWKEVSVGRWVTATVSGHNKGGLELKVGPLQAFLPISQIGERNVEDLAAYVGRSMVCEVTQADPSRQRLVLSRRRVLEEERRKGKEERLRQLVVGAVARGTIDKVEPFGAFVDLGGGLRGLLHVSNLSHQRVQDPSTVVEPGQTVEVQILSIEEGGKKIGLGLKQLTRHPWEDVPDRFQVNQIVEGTVRRVESFGAFVELCPGVEGLLHVSQMAAGRVQRPQEVVKSGERIVVRVLSIDPAEKRVSLSRLNERGAVIGSEGDLSAEEIQDASTSVFREDNVPRAGTNLGDVLRRSLEDRSRKDRKKR